MKTTKQHDDSTLTIPELSPLKRRLFPSSRSSASAWMVALLAEEKSRNFSGPVIPESFHASIRHSEVLSQ